MIKINLKEVGNLKTPNTTDLMKMILKYIWKSKCLEHGQNSIKKRTEGELALSFIKPCALISMMFVLD